MSIGGLIYNRRKELGLTLEQVGIGVGVGKSTVKKWESGAIANIKRDKITNLANVLQISPFMLLDGGAAAKNNPAFMKTPRKIPLLGTISCGVPILAQENVLSMLEIPEGMRADFALVCRGDSMIDARIYNGDTVYIRSQSTVNNGEIGAVLIDDEATLKRIFFSNDTLTLVPCNSRYQPFVYKGEELENVKILGKAVGFTSKI